MVFLVFELLSTIFNQYFYNVTVLGIVFPFNVSVIFFCLGFFILDITTEIYNNKEADKLVYGKVVCQIIFFIFGKIGIIGACLQDSQLDTIISTTPTMMVNGVLASLTGYKVTTHIMQRLKISCHGRFLPIRYLCASLPGEIIFSLVFSLLSFFDKRIFHEWIMIFFTLTIVKIVLSFLFAFIVIPVTGLIRYFGDIREAPIQYIPFT
ncbi:MAG: putative vitamin uptake transporter [Gammaproteobacteria bacterium]|nr:putative vitamin uptake transporter [Gammaproteobacteria bacterium]